MSAKARESKKERKIEWSQVTMEIYVLIENENQCYTM